MRKKKIFKICIILLIFLLIILIYKIISLKNNKATSDITDVAKPIYIKNSEKKLYPENIFAIVYRYKGNADLITIYNSLYKFKTYIEILSDYNNSIEEYYKENINNVREYTGLENIDNFKKLFNEVQKLKKSSKQFEKAYIDIDSILEEDDKITCKLDMKYKDVTLSFKFIVLYSGTNSRNTYIYEAL